MQILANALPGFRDLRGPVVTGYLWLLFGWLVVHPNLDCRPPSKIGGALFDAGHQVGRVGVFIAISVAAYFIGTASQLVSERLTARIRAIAELSPLAFLGYSGDPIASMFANISAPVMDIFCQAHGSPNPRTFVTSSRKCATRCATRSGKPSTLLGMNSQCR